MDLKILIPAILTYIREKNGFATKTKLLKLLYLLDIEAFRRTGSTLTAFTWTFYLYGPWAPAYEEVLSALTQSGIISVQAGSRPDLDTVFVDAVDKVALHDAFPAIAEELQARRVIEAWADRPTGELLDYVYFHTAPMREARRGDSLDFSSILKEETIPEYRRTSSKVDRATLKKRQREFFDALSSAPRPDTAPKYVSPRYDEEFWQAIAILEKDTD